MRGWRTWNKADAVALRVMLIAVPFLVLFVAMNAGGPPQFDEPGDANAVSYEKASTANARSRFHARIPPPPRLEGTTRFVRRLEAGLYFKKVRPLVLHENRRQAFAALKPLLSTILYSDDLAVGQKTPNTTDEMRRLLGILTDPPRDLDSLHLAGQSDDDDPLGRDRLVRFWTQPGKDITDMERRSVVRSFRHVVRTALGSTQPGFDVLVAEKLGTHVFPKSRGRASGYYLPGDDFSIVEYDLSRWRRIEVAKHELIHALWRRTLEWDRDHRVLSEGVAEYLRYSEPGDDGLRIPRERLGALFGSVRRAVAFLKSAGIPTELFSPKRLLDMRPVEFYGLGRFGYLLATAIVACVGGDLVEECFRTRSDAPLLYAAKHLEWNALMSFVRGPAKPSDAPEKGWALVVSDVTEGLTSDHAVRRAAAQNALSRLAGTRVNITRLLELEAELDARALAGIEFERSRRRFLFLDRSAAMDAVSVKESKDAEPETARAHVLRLTGRFPGTWVSLDSAARVLGAHELAEEAQLELASIPAALGRSGALTTTFQKPAWLFAIASPAGDRRSTPEDAATRIARRVDELRAKLAVFGTLAPRAVLIVDYTREGPSAALVVERALRAVLHESVPIGVWRATKDGVISASLPHVYETPR